MDASCNSEEQARYRHRYRQHLLQLSLSLYISLIARDDAYNSLAPIRFAALRIFLPLSRESYRQEYIIPSTRSRIWIGSPFRLPISKSYAWRRVIIFTRFSNSFLDPLLVLCHFSPNWFSLRNLTEIWQSVKLTLPSLLNCFIISFLENWLEKFRDNYGY